MTTCVEGVDISIAVTDRDAVAVASHRSDSCRNPYPTREGSRQAFNVGTATADNGAPWRPIAEPEQAVTVLKADERCGRVIKDGVGGRRPDRSRHRQQVVASKRFSISVGVKIIAERYVKLFQHGSVAGRLAIKASQVVEHGPEARAEQVALFGKQTGKIGSGILDVAVGERNRERHIRQLRWNFKMSKKRREIGIGQLVVDNESGIDRNGTLRPLHGNGVRMSPDATIAFINRDLVTLAEQPGR